MVSFEDDDEGAASPGSSSDNDVDETMEDVNDVDADGDGDGDGDGDIDPDGDADGDEGDEDGDNDDDDEQEDDATDTPTRPSRSTNSTQPYLTNGVSSSSHHTEDHGGPDSSNPTVLLTAPSPRPGPQTPGQGTPSRLSVRAEALTAPVYDIVPTIAAPHSTSINAVTATPDMRWVFSGGSDGFIRKFNWIETANGKLALTVAQRHPFVDSVTKAGVLMSYWENEDSDDKGSISISGDQTLSPVYSLAVQNQALWLLSGLETGGINLQSVRHDEGKRITCLRKHTNAVSVLTLASDEKTVLSGSWDKTINDWDLNTGQVRRKFETSGGQISAIEMRPFSTLPVPEETGVVQARSTTFSSNNAAKPQSNGTLPNGVSTGVKDEGIEDAQGSPDDSLFGDNNSLFGDDKDAPSGAAPGAPFGDDDEDEFTRALATGLQQQEEDIQADLSMVDSGGPVQPPEAPLEDEPGAPAQPSDDLRQLNGEMNDASSAKVNGLPHADDDNTGHTLNGDTNSHAAPPSVDTVFLDASHDGTIRVWDRRQQSPIARIVPSRSIPPWCMNACWSPDGNFIYAGRRNGTVEEYSLHKGLREPDRHFKFPAVSGPVSAVKAMPNGKHLICASYDILRLYDLKEPEISRHSAVPYLIVPGHRTGVVSSLYIDPTCSFMISTGGNRGWEGSSTEVLLGYEIGIGTL